MEANPIGPMGQQEWIDSVDFNLYCGSRAYMDIIECWVPVPRNKTRPPPPRVHDMEAKVFDVITHRKFFIRSFLHYLS